MTDEPTPLPYAQSWGPTRDRLMGKPRPTTRTDWPVARYGAVLPTSQRPWSDRVVDTGSRLLALGALVLGLLTAGSVAVRGLFGG